ncbi:UbiA prenyltransferase family protein [Deminuibacter soli]|uniref:Prenyltransferase n=1 Tax=Deminuibacter soli TaxID=2291815 RepID=A0A3E1NGI0_9BACT|nr:hypothetical protein [Deminuibacter soli]RFM27070.1 hypothetical protein DXN05_16515 [Deminuibacter soli]
MLKKISWLLIFGNYFYALCAVALAIESNLQIGFTLNSGLFYLMLFTGTVVYYTRAYISEQYVHSTNPRTLWYSNHRRLVFATQLILTIVCAIAALLYLWEIRSDVFHISPWHWVIAALVPLVAAFYYDIPLLGFMHLNLRKTGWMKPFVIGFVWAGAVTLYPVIFRVTETRSAYIISLLEAWFFLKNWMFITVLCIMFDIKDYASDSNLQLKTFVVQYGLRKTLFFIIIPLTITGLISLQIFAHINHFPALKIAINTIPFIALLVVAYSLHRRKNIVYYLTVIDGLMLLKAVCGILGVELVK